MSSKIYNIDSDPTLLEELSAWIRNRKISQKFIYQWEWAKLYYKDKYSNPMYNKESLQLYDFSNFINNKIKIKNKKIALISLWCGNSETEAYIYKNSDFNEVDYFWIDASKWMLKLSIDNFKKIKCTKTFIAWDFTTKTLKLELHDLTKEYNEKIFVFLVIHSEIYNTQI